MEPCYKRDNGVASSHSPAHVSNRQREFLVDGRGLCVVCGDWYLSMRGNSRLGANERRIRELLGTREFVPKQEW